VAEPSPVTQITVTVRYFAAARAAAGVPDESLTVSSNAVRPAATGQPAGAGDGPGAATVGLVLNAAIGRHGAALATVLRRCSFLLDEVAVHGTETRVRPGQVLDVLPPFAGG
jgi:molybdopterin converting factor small subunit